jgi:capsular exopolysaccharide synthesis family protein
VLDGVVSELHLDRTFTPPLPAAAAAAFQARDSIRPGTYRLKVDEGGRTYTLSSAGRTEYGAVGDSVGRTFGFEWMPAAALLPANSTRTIVIMTPRDAAKSLGDALQIHIDQEGNFLHMELSGTDPRRLAATLNAVAAHYVDVAAELKRKKVVELSATLADQTTLATRSLASAEQELQAFQKRTALLPGDAAGARAAAQLGTYSDISTRLDATRHTRTALEQILAAPLDSTFTVGELDAIALTEHAPELTAALTELNAKRAELRTLRAKYSDQNPLVMRPIHERDVLETETIPVLSRRMLAQVRRREVQLDSQLVVAGAVLQDLPARDLEAARLRRNVTLAENLYSALQQKADEAQIAKASSVADVRILDVAAPPQVTTTNATVRVILLAALAGLALGLLTAILLDRTDKKFRYPEQVTLDLGLAILGAIPHLRGGKDTVTRPHANNAFNEALRDLRMNVSYAFGASGPVTFAMTSPGSEDGKSFLASNLARVFAENGRRTVLIDGDLRRGQLHRRFSVERNPGLADYLGGNASIDQVLRTTEIAGLDIITSGIRRADAPELLGTQRMLQIIGEMRSRYDVVICDSPPLAAGIDAAVLGAATGNLVVTVRTGVSLREVAAAKLDIIARLPIRVLGAILNDVPNGNVYSYYAHYALPGYEATNERVPSRELEAAGRS